jgi:DNA-binding MarR family transcriptional regulator
MSVERGMRIYEVLRETRPLVLNSARAVEATLKHDGISVGMRAVLETLARNGPSTVPAIAHHLDLARQGIQRHVDDLTRLGHLQTRANPAHRRSALIQLTTAGQALFTRIRAGELDSLAPMAAECSAAEIATALKVLRALNRDVRRRAREHHRPDPEDPT